VYGDIRIDREARTVFVDDEPVTLRPREFDLLLALVSQAGRVISRQRLLQQVWRDHEIDEASRTLDVHVNRLRQKLQKSRVRIESIRGIGYRLALSES
jgi:DNA-binding response OmpR family regulator